MPVHTCAPPKGSAPEAQTLWICPGCGSTWEAAPDVGIFDFDRNEAITRAEWVLIGGPDYLAG